MQNHTPLSQLVPVVARRAKCFLRHNRWWRDRNTDADPVLCHATNNNIVVNFGGGRGTDWPNRSAWQRAQKETVSGGMDSNSTAAMQPKSRPEDLEALYR